jgi:hypothetical protein
MPPTPALQPEDIQAKVAQLRAMKKEREEAELTAINADRATRGLPLLTELPQLVMSHDSGRQRPSNTPLFQRVLRPVPKTGKEAAARNDDDAPEIEQIAPGVFKRKEE